MTFPITIFALAASGVGVSGGDRIFIEFAKRWSLKHHVEIVVWEEGKAMCERLGLSQRNGLTIRLCRVGRWKKAGFLVNYLHRIMIGVSYALKLGPNFRPQIVYSASEFWMDSIPAIILKIWHPETFWVAAWYQTAPNPLRGYTGDNIKGRYRFKAIVYWLVQLPIKPLISRLADLVLVNNEEERIQFPLKDKKNKVAVVLGAINTPEINKFKEKFKGDSKIFDGVFQGRFHPQKGVVELIQIWKRVVDLKQGAKLAMIGNGPLMRDVKERIKLLGLERNIKLFGYLFDGEEKYKVFAQSRVVLHPSFYDSGGMAGAEAMAFDIPMVAFDLPAYKSYYPKGVLKVETGNLDKFAQAILQLLNNEKDYDQLKKEATELIEGRWSWDTRAEEILSKIKTLIK